jgi:phage tail-like protein
MANVRDDPYAQFNFLIELGESFTAGFTEASGLTAESDVIEYRLSSAPPTPKKLPGILKYGNITLKRGYTQEDTLWKWRKTTLDRKTERRDGAIVLQDEAGDEVMRWTFRNGWLSKYEGPSLNSTTNEAAIESIEIVHEGLEFELT